MNEGENARALDAVNKQPKWSSITVVQNASGALLVALVVALSNRGCALWDRVDNIERSTAVTAQRIQLINRDLRDLEKCLARLDAVEDEVARIPQNLPYPFSKEWQNRILKNTDAINTCGCNNRRFFGESNGQR